MSAQVSAPSSWFDRWWEPGEFFRAVLDYIGSLPSPDDVVTGTQYQPVRDAYVGGFFALIRSQHAETPVCVRLEADRFPDLWIKIGECVQPFEVVEALRPGRRRGDEYRREAARKAAGFPPRFHFFDPVAEQNAAVSVVARCLKQKARKSYRPAPSLLVYVNLSLFTQVESAMLARLAEIAAPYRGYFPEVWLLWGRNAIRCTPCPVHLAATALPPELIP